MEEKQAEEVPQAVLDRLGLSERDVEQVSDYFMSKLRKQWREEFYRDVGKGVVRIGWKAVACVLAYLAWKGSGGSTGWIEFVRKLVMG